MNISFMKAEEHRLFIEKSIVVIPERGNYHYALTWKETL